MLLFAVLRESTKYLNRNPSSLLITICQTLSVYELIRNEPKGPDFHTWYFLRNHWLIGYYWLRLGLRLLLLCLAHSSRWSSTIFSKNWYAIHTYVQWSMIWQQYIPMLLISYVQQYATSWHPLKPSCIRHYGWRTLQLVYTFVRHEHDYWSIDDNDSVRWLFGFGFVSALLVILGISASYVR